MTNRFAYSPQPFFNLPNSLSASSKALLILLGFDKRLFLQNPDKMNAMKSLSRPALIAAALTTLGLLGSCAPRQQTGTVITSSTQVNSISFYPFETGLIWNYLPEGDTSKDIPYVMQTQGPTVFLGQPVIASQLSGRGAQQTWYRTYDNSGIKLFGLRKPGVTVSLSPAWQEAPAADAWRVGLHWEGSSSITVQDDTGKVQAKGTLIYRYDVQDTRQVTTPAGTYKVWVVTRQISDDVGGLFPAAQQYWFAPYVGDLRTPENLLLTSKNFNVKGGGK